jgi:hypothetical protein
MCPENDGRLRSSPAVIGAHKRVARLLVNWPKTKLYEIISSSILVCCTVDAVFDVPGCTGCDMSDSMRVW